MPESTFVLSCLEGMSDILVPSSRRPFTPPDHWLAPGRFDMQSFIEAAMFVPYISSILCLAHLAIVRKTPTFRSQLERARLPLDKLQR